MPIADLAHTGASGGSGWNPDTVASAATFDGGYLERTPSATGDTQNWSFCIAVQRVGYGTNQGIFSAGRAGPNYLSIRFSTTDKILIQNRIGAVNLIVSETTKVYRDSGWYLLLIRFVNGQFWIEDQTGHVEGPFGAVDDACVANSQIPHGTGGDSAANPPSKWAIKGNEAQAVFGDGAAWSMTDVWDQFTYGTNGLQYVPKADVAIEALAASAGGNSFALTSSIATGQDSSGNGNHFTVTGSVSETANTPSNPHAVLNSLLGNTGFVSGGGTVFSSGVSIVDLVWSNIGFDVEDSDGFYFEASASLQDSYIGVCDGTMMTSNAAATTPGVTAINPNGDVYSNGAFVGTGLPYAPNDIVGVWVRNGEFYFSVNGVASNNGSPIVTGLTGTYFAYMGRNSSSRQPVLTAYFAESEWTYTPPNNFKALNAANLPTPTTQGADVFQTLLRNGTGSTLSQTGAGFQPDMLWFKARNVNADHRLVDSVRGEGLRIAPNERYSEANVSGVTFDADGFTITNGTSSYNGSGQTYVDWLWAAGGAPVANTDGSITSQVSAHPAGHFSIVSYTGTGSVSTVGHGLGNAPSLWIVKQRNGTSDWPVGNTGLSSPGHVMYLNTSDAQSITGLSIKHWNNTLPDMSVVYLAGAGYAQNDTSAEYIMHCFANVPGLLKVGTYKGNGSTDGPYVHCGFRPRWLLVKAVDVATSWHVFDTERSQENPVIPSLIVNASTAESTAADRYDILADGFKARQPTGYGGNNSGATYLYMAIANIAGGGDLPPIFGR